MRPVCASSPRATSRSPIAGLARHQATGIPVRSGDQVQLQAPMGRYRSRGPKGSLERRFVTVAAIVGRPRIGVRPRAALGPLTARGPATAGPALGPLTAAVTVGPCGPVDLGRGVPERGP